MMEKSKTLRNENSKNKKEKPRQLHTPEGPAEEFIDEYTSINRPPPPPAQKK